MHRIQHGVAQHLVELAENPKMDPSVSRLLAAARERRNDKTLTLADVGKAIGISSATMTNWKKRGISKDGAIAAERVFGCAVQFVMDGKEPKFVGYEAAAPSAPHEVREPGTADWSRETSQASVTIKLSLRTLSLAERLEALSEERRARTSALIDLVLRTSEAEE
jgi:transcriptional regulator with XRE-family HTH domain